MSSTIISRALKLAGLLRWQELAPAETEHTGCRVHLDIWKRGSFEPIVTASPTTAGPKTHGSPNWAPVENTPAEKGESRDRRQSPATSNDKAERCDRKTRRREFPLHCYSWHKRPNTQNAKKPPRPDRGQPLEPPLLVWNEFDLANGLSNGIRVAPHPLKDRQIVHSVHKIKMRLNGLILWPIEIVVHQDRLGGVQCAG